MRKRFVGRVRIRAGVSCSGPGGRALSCGAIVATRAVIPTGAILSKRAVIPTRAIGSPGPFIPAGPLLRAVATAFRRPGTVGTSFNCATGPGPIGTILARTAGPWSIVRGRPGLLRAPILGSRRFSIVRSVRFSARRGLTRRALITRRGES